MTAAPEIALDDSHTYRVNGIVVPGVTQVLAQVEPFAGIPPAVLEYAAERGRAVHLATQLWDDYDLDESVLDPVIKPYLAAWIQFRQDTGFVVSQAELIVYSDRHRFCGMLDRKGLLYGEPCILDIKAVAVISPVTALQTAAYAEASRTDRRAKSPRRAAVQLRPDGTFRWAEFEDKTDLSVFLSLLQLWSWRKTHLKEITNGT